MMPIPKVMHRIWLGGPMPDEFQRYGEAWARLHPDWKQRLWSEDDLFPLQNQALYDDAKRIAGSSMLQFRADVMRYEVLYKYGGVYVDADFEPLKSIDELLEDVGCFAAWETDNVWVNNAIMGAMPFHPFVGDLIRSLPANVESFRGSRPNKLSGPQFLTGIYRQWSGVTVFPSRLFYPYLWNELDRKGEEFPDAYAVHHWNNARKRLAVLA